MENLVILFIERLLAATGLLLFSLQISVSSSYFEFNNIIFIFLLPFTFQFILLHLIYSFTLTFASIFLKLLTIIIIVLEKKEIQFSSYFYLQLLHFFILCRISIPLNPIKEMHFNNMNMSTRRVHLKIRPKKSIEILNL